MATLLAILFQLSGLFSDFELLLKITGMIFIYSFVKQHVQHVVLSTILIIGMCAFLLFDVWKIFGGALLLYLIVTFGFTHLLVDLSFMGAFGESGDHGGGHDSKKGGLQHAAVKALFGKRGGGRH